jgi:hypothetical protein
MMSVINQLIHHTNYLSIDWTKQPARQSVNFDQLLDQSFNRRVSQHSRYGSNDSVAYFEVSEYKQSDDQSMWSNMIIVLQKRIRLFASSSGFSAVYEIDLSLRLMVDWLIDWLIDCRHLIAWLFHCYPALHPSRLLLER